MRSRVFGEHNFFKEIKETHPECVGVMGAVRYMLSSGRDGDEEVARLVSHLCDLVESHLLAEKDDGYFEEEVHRSPSFAEAMMRLRRQHVWLLEQLREVRSLIENRDCMDRESWRRELGERFERFARRLLMHEAEEDDLLQEVFGPSEASVVRRGRVGSA
jgi:hypothetical protein